MVYEFGSCVGEHGEPLAWPLVASRVDARIKRIVDAVEATSYTLYLTSDDRSNFRYNVATIKPYKGQRSSEKPYWYKKIREYLVKFRGAEMIYGMEADDALSIDQVKHSKLEYDNILDVLNEPELTVICSRDKDLLMVPGWHYVWAAGGQKERKLWWQDEHEAITCFYRQLLTGDSVDNIPGLFGVGNNSSHLRVLSECSNELEMFIHVKGQYEKRFGAYWWQFLKENALLLWMLRSSGNTNEVVERLEGLTRELFVQDLNKLSQNN